jgi:hydrogenase maturation protease
VRRLTAPLLIFAYGNPSRGDDALGPQLLDLLAESQVQHPEWLEFELLTDFQLQVEHSVDLEGRELALFIDASVSCQSPFLFSSLQPAQDARYTTHEMSPEAVLHVFEQVYQRPSPPAFLLSVRGESFDLGEPLSPAAVENRDAAMKLLVQLCSQPNLKVWETITTVIPAKAGIQYF